MDLVLWRHADAEDGVPDLARRLTAKGHEQAARVGEWLDRRLPPTCRILASPARRAQETVQALRRPFETVDALAPGADPVAVLQLIAWPQGRETILIVGHQPTLGRMAALVLSGADRDWSIRKAGAWWLSRREHAAEDDVLVRAVIGPDLV